MIYGEEDFPGGSVLKNLLSVKKMQARSLGQEESLEEEMAIHSSILSWSIPWTEEPGGLQSMRSQKDLDMTEWLSIPKRDSMGLTWKYDINTDS